MSLLITASPGEFRALREFLHESLYTEAEILERLQFDGLYLVLAGKRPEGHWNYSDALGLLIRLLLLGDTVSATELEALIPSEVLSVMEAVGLLDDADRQAEHRYAPVMLYPVGNLFIASDRFSNPDGSPFCAPDDVVYPAITKNSAEFLTILPSRHCNSMLELCGGTGAAVIGASFRGIADHCWTEDIAARATEFAEFNIRLNGVENVVALTGDLYEPVDGQRFDRIIAHPPYVPAKTPKWVFRDAGDSGEAVTHRIISGAPDHLEPGGVLYCLALGLERKEEPLEGRLRGWLGEKHNEFDVLMVESDTFTPERIASLPVLSGQRSVQEYQEYRRQFADSGVDQFCYGLMVVQRAREDRPVFTVRRTSSRRTGSLEIEWLITSQTHFALEPNRLALLDEKPCMTKDMALEVVHGFRDRELMPTGFRLRTDYPFELTCEIQPWTAQLIAKCDGTRTGRELYSFCRESGLIVGEVTAEDFTILIRDLVSGGFLNVNSVSLPGAAG